MTIPQTSDSGCAVMANDLGRIYRSGRETVVGVRHIDLTIAPGELVVLKGVSGSGKSTLLSLIAGLDQPTEGELEVGGYRLSGASPGDLTRFRRHVVGMVFQSFNLLPTLTVLENVCLPAQLAGVPTQRSVHRADQLLEWLGMEHRRQFFPGRLSGGEMQRTAIARALINDPAIILADEPTGNLDSRNGDIVVQLLSDLNLEQGRTIVFATHSDVADAVATRQIRLHDGELVG